MRKPAIALFRALMYIVVASPLLALAASILGPGPVESSRIMSRKWDVVCDPGTPGRATGHPRHYLVDRQSGKAEALTLPEDERWGMLSVSPWCDPDGNTEAVGQCYSPATAADGGAFWGLARLRLPQGSLIDKVRLDLLPTSRPCWVPGRPGMILFAAGDGHLHHFDFSKQIASEDGSDARAIERNAPVVPKTVAWNTPRPSSRGAVFLTDPAWPAHPAFPQYVLTMLITAPVPPQKGPSACHRLWWLKMSEDGTAIEGSGPLIQPAAAGSEEAPSIKRYPSLAVGREGSLHVIYLARGRAAGLRLEALPIEADPQSGCPRVVAGARPQIIASDCGLAPPIVSADHKVVYAISSSTGLVVEHPIGPETDLATR